jgi:hypothetical protein
MERKARYLLEKEPISLPCMNEVLREAQIHRSQAGFLKAAGTAVQSFVSKDFYRAICWQSRQ